ncbi:lipopolysaccharide transport system permease protein [Neorhizobium galegae]|uniref:ABC transporter permease n=1 Tax=Neorhizobium galegae TaxID=399 RepID=UPI001FDABB7B|nr:ABC transporter permease [Neorhizobium galegae]MBP2547679.1 lipopolysaccharide transport system permease protein [Neorhizobium galegae]
MQAFPATLREMAASQWRHRGLLKASIRREVLGRYRGSFLGVFWSFFNPLLMLSVYTFVFSSVLKAKWGTGGGSKAEFALVLFAGLMTFNLFAETINRASGLIVGNPNYVKKVVFPLEILPTVVLGSALFHLIVSLSVWFLAYLVFYGLPPATVVFFPLVLLPLCIFTLGISWILASLGVYLRDVSQFIGVATTALMFLSPVFYPASALPDDMRIFLYLNPLTPAIELSRDVLFWGKAPDFPLLGLYGLASLAVAWVGFAWFQATRKGFADVL